MKLEFTRDAVLSAIAECDDLGRKQFLADNGFEAAREYFLIHHGQAYDSKAVAGVAHRLVTGQRVRSADFQGGAAVADELRALGFTITGDADWTWDELLLACDVIATNEWRTVREDSDEVRNLSAYLREEQPLPAHSPEFRSPSSVHRKLEDLRSAHPDYTGATTRGGRATKAMAAAFAADYETMHRLASEVLKLGTESDEDTSVPGEASAAEIVTAAEGRVVRRLTTMRERDRGLRDAKLAQFRAAHQGRVFCEVCSFDFGKAYGAHGKGYAEVHHRVPLHVTDEVVNDLHDLIVLCANCHRMIHRRTPWLTPEELAALLH
ncbi:HNH endonuclease [Gordonia shandongensis]|uniref:HNH endonuclease n=1 Tax=Gordonia shandongensis TaxID=376351 RepID=UPI00040C7992|nr:HNH endonuclease [Gordonia shandongensis]